MHTAKPTAKSILLVEDSPELQQSYNDLLTSEQYLVEVVSTGTAALTALQKKAPDMILLDIMLPGGMNGWDVLKHIRTQETTQSTPVIVLTNLSSENQVARELGATSYVVKANTPADELLKLIKHLLY
ncbi:response regulator [Candidatus Woesebacteria bacterium]|nr:response regulator [Candidatus Woesebacteria bacterium]